MRLPVEQARFRQGEIKIPAETKDVGSSPTIARQLPEQSGQNMAPSQGPYYYGAYAPQKGKNRIWIITIATFTVIALAALAVFVFDPFGWKDSNVSNAIQETRTIEKAPEPEVNQTAKQRAPRILTNAFAISPEDGFVSIRKEPSSKAKELCRLYEQSRGLGDGILLERGEKWSKVEVGDVIGYAYNKYLGTQTWYTGKGETVLVAAKDKTPIYVDYDDPYPVFTYVEKGTIIADDYDFNDKYYVLGTAHDYLMIKKSDVNVISTQRSNTTPPLKAAIINDPDGYTNVRSRKSAKSSIVTCFYDGEVFYYKKEKGNWWRVYRTQDEDSFIGYMYYNRIKNL